MGSRDNGGQSVLQKGPVTRDVVTPSVGNNTNGPHSPTPSLPPVCVTGQADGLRERYPKGGIFLSLFKDN